MATLRKHRWPIAGMVLSGLAAGLLTGAVSQSWHAVRNAAKDRRDAASAMVDSQNIRSAKLRLEAVRAELAHAVVEEGPEPDQAAPTAAVTRIHELQAELIKAETERNARAAASTDDADARHHEDLLRITYETQLDTLSTAEQKAARVSLLRDEVSLMEQSYWTLGERRSEMNAEAKAAESRSAFAADNDIAGRRTLEGTAGALLGGILGIGIFLYRDGHKRQVLVHPLASSEHAAPLYPDAAGDPADTAAIIATTASAAPIERVLETSEPHTPYSQPDAIVAPVERPAPLLQGPRHGVIPAVANVSNGSTAVISQDAESAFPQSRDVFFGARWSAQPRPLEEACRDAMYSILLADWGKGIRSYAIVSPNREDGKTTVLSNMAVALSRAQMRVVLVDANLQQPGLHQTFDVVNSSGLRNILRGELDLHEASIDELTSRTELSHVALVPVGTGGDVPAEWPRSPRFAHLLERLTRAFDLVLIDTSSDTADGEAVGVASRCGGTILLLRCGRTRPGPAVEIHDGLVSAGAYLTGTVLNGFAGMPDDSSYFDTHGESGA